MSEGVRVIGPDRVQLRWDMVDLDSQLPDDHRARLVWAFVEGLDLSEFYDRIKARDAVAGRPATDPPVVLAVWLYATLEGIGAARAIDRLCQQHAAYRWLCGGAPINHDLLAGFRRENAALLDRLMRRIYRYRWCLRASRSAAISPSLMTSAIRCGSCKIGTAVSGSPATTTRSASLPGSIVPRSSPRPMHSAAQPVAARNACSGVMPALTRHAISIAFFG